MTTETPEDIETIGACCEDDFIFDIPEDLARDAAVVDPEEDE